jgi:hypothetical protein
VLDGETVLLGVDGIQTSMVSWRASEGDSPAQLTMFVDSSRRGCSSVNAW